ncbi:MAG TPA: hypothetical protein VGF64_01945 [Acidimicrobiales bacterium]|jgi:hypothetical protein
MNRADERRAWSVERLADAWDISSKSVWRLIGRGELVALRIGTRTLVTAESVDAYEQAHSQRVVGSDEPAPPAPELSAAQQRKRRQRQMSRAARTRKAASG